MINLGVDIFELVFSYNMLKSLNKFEIYPLVGGKTLWLKKNFIQSNLR
jgi:hypothetical protein